MWIHVFSTVSNFLILKKLLAYVLKPYPENMHVIFSRMCSNYQQVLSSNTEFTWKMAPQVIILIVNLYSKMWLSKVITVNYRAWVQLNKWCPFTDSMDCHAKGLKCASTKLPEGCSEYVWLFKTTEILKEIRIINDHITERVYFFLSNYFKNCDCIVFYNGLKLDIMKIKLLFWQFTDCSFLLERGDRFSRNIIYLIILRSPVLGLYLYHW